MALPSDINDVLQGIINGHKIPGISIALVKDGKCIHATGLGVTNFKELQPVTPDTKFCIGSITKSFTSALLASLLAENKSISWDTPLCRIFGEELEFPDKMRTENATLRDLLAHKMGIELGESDFGWMCGSLERQDILKNLKHIPVAADFRTKLMYNNFMYALAGIVAEKIAGMPWEKCLKERLFSVLGMNDTCFLDEEGPEWEGFATPHMSVKGKVTALDLNLHKCVKFVGPCGSICSTAADMAKWIIFQLDKGRVDGIPIIPSHMLEECQKPQFALPAGKPEWSGFVNMPDFPVTESRSSYGFGWYMGHYRGYRIVSHSGELFGYDAQVTFYPDMNVGIYTAQNGPGGEHAFLANQLLHYYLSDYLLSLDSWISHIDILTFPAPWQPKKKELFLPQRTGYEIIKGKKTRKCLDSYVGTYKNNFLGQAVIKIHENTLQMEFGKIGDFFLHPVDMEKDHFLVEGQGILSFLHHADYFSPSDWRMVCFSDTDSGSVSSFHWSIMESAPTFVKIC